jgi:hypothetical protein
MIRSMYIVKTTLNPISLSPKPVLKRTVEGQPVQNQNAQPQADRSLRHEKSVLVWILSIVLSP